MRLANKMDALNQLGFIYSQLKEVKKIKSQTYVAGDTSSVNKSSSTIAFE